MLCGAGHCAIAQPTPAEHAGRIDAYTDVPSKTGLRDRLRDVIHSASPGCAEYHAAYCRECTARADAVMAVVRPELDKRTAETAEARWAAATLSGEYQRAEAAEAENARLRADAARAAHTCGCPEADQAYAQMQAEIDRLRAGESDQPSSKVPQAWTPAEWIHWWNRATADERLDAVRRIYDASRIMATCICDRHERQIAELTERAEAAERQLAELRGLHQQIGDL
jgi:RPA family protein